MSWKPCGHCLLLLKRERAHTAFLFLLSFSLLFAYGSSVCCLSVWVFAVRFSVPSRLLTWNTGFLTVDFVFSAA